MIGHALIAGALTSGGLVLTWWGWRRTEPRLSAALDVIEGRAPTLAPSWRQPRRRTAQLLKATGRDVVDLHREQLLLSAVFAVCAGVTAAAWVSVGGPAWSLAVAVVLGAVAGLAYPTLVLRTHQLSSTSEATWAMFTYLDVVVLERLANRSAAGALSTASTACDHPVFVAIREHLERAQLSSRPPGDGLRAAALELGLPGLAHVADIVDMEQSGASLVDALRAQVGELRHAHTTEQLARAHADTERLAIPMVLPVVVFALIFLTPPLLRLIGA